jgi:histidine ammonia-lyase
MLRALLVLSLALLLSTSLLWRNLSASKAEAAKLRSSVAALQASAARSSRANALRSKLLAEATAAQVESAKALERALAGSPEWAATQVPREVQDAP